MNLYERIFGKVNTTLPAQISPIATAIGTNADDEDDNTLCGYMYTAKRIYTGVTEVIRL